MNFLLGGAAGALGIAGAVALYERNPNANGGFLNIAIACIVLCLVFRDGRP